MLPLRISVTTWRLACSRQLRCVTQLGPIIGILKPGGGVNTWKRPLLPKGKLSRPERLVKAVGHHKMQSNAFPDMQCTMLIMKSTRRPTRILTPSLQKSTTLLTSLEERKLVVGGKLVKNDAGEMSMSKDSKQKAWLEHYWWLLNVEFDWNTDYLSDEPPVEGPPIPITSDMVLRKLSLKWSWAKHWAHQA